MCKIIVVVGGKGRIGSKLVSYLEKENTVISADINSDDFSVDIASSLSVENLIKKVHEKYPKIDVMVNCTYPRTKDYGKEFFEVTYTDFCENMSLHLGGYFLLTQKFSEFFVKQGYGNIINFSSIYGVIAPKFEIYQDISMTMPVQYAVIKAGILHLNKYMAKYLKGKNIRFNCISPGGILDGQDSSFVSKYNENCCNKGMLDSEDLFGTISFLVGDDSKYINGQNIIVDDGFCL